jgi:hypothetical protein
MFDADKIFPWGRLQPSYKAENKFLSEITYDILDDRKPVLYAANNAAKGEKTNKFSSLRAKCRIRRIENKIWRTVISLLSGRCLLVALYSNRPSEVLCPDFDEKQ